MRPSPGDARRADEVLLAPALPLGLSGRGGIAARRRRESTAWICGTRVIIVLSRALLLLEFRLQAAVRSARAVGRGRPPVRAVSRRVKERGALGRPTPRRDKLGETNKGNKKETKEKREKMKR